MGPASRRNGDVVPSVEPVTGDDDAPSGTRDLPGALHEVSNALTVLIGWIGRARDARGAPEEIERALEIAADRASQARAIVRRAIGAEVDDELPVSAATLLRGAALGLHPEAEAAGVALELTIDPPCEANLLASPSEVTQILTNLLLNAIGISSSGQSVRARATSAASNGGTMASFVVEDDGPGVPVERRATLFDGGVSTRRGGAGIGLRYAAGRARVAGGALRLVPSDRGARFELLWPLASLPARPPPSPPSSPDASRKKPLAGTRILILEDDLAVIDLLDTALTARGAEVVAIRRSADLAEALSSGPFQAALFDISPIHEDIRGALGAVRARSSDVRLVVISGSAQSMPTLPSEWVAAWVRKPFEIGEILAALAPV